MSEMWYAYKILLENMNGRNEFGDKSLCERVILKWVLKKQDVDNI
jgi:hypothetical protein